MLGSRLRSRRRPGGRRSRSLASWARWRRRFNRTIPNPSTPLSNGSPSSTCECSNLFFFFSPDWINRCMYYVGLCICILLVETMNCSLVRSVSILFCPVLCLFPVHLQPICWFSEFLSVTESNLFDCLCDCVIFCWLDCKCNSSSSYSCYELLLEYYFLMF